MVAGGQGCERERAYLGGADPSGAKGSIATRLVSLPILVKFCNWLTTNEWKDIGKDRGKDSGKDGVGVEDDDFPVPGK